MHYTCLDAATLSLDELTSLKQSNPEAFQSLRLWVRAGGQLWVNDVGTDFERLPELSELLQLRPKVASDVKLSDESPLERVDEGSVPAAGWHPLQIIDGSFDGQVATFMDQRNGTTRTVRNPREIDSALRPPTRPWVPLSAATRVSGSSSTRLD
jgi:hypothetical protein